jgi:hypothetical protein
MGELRDADWVLEDEIAGRIREGLSAEHAPR